MSASREPNPGLRAHALSAVAWLASAVSLSISLSLPTVTFRQVGAPRETYSIYGGIQQLWEDGTHVLATVVFLFSIVFPIGKLAALALVCLRVGGRSARRATVRWLELLGKWSILDVFIVAVFIGSIRLGALANASSRVGIFVFGASILLSMISTRLIGRVELGGEALPLRKDPELRRWPQALLSTAALSMLVAAFVLPVFEVKKAVVFKSQLELSRTTWKMASNGELVLAVAFGLLVIGTTATRALIVLRLRWFRGRSERAVRWVLWLEEWTMIDVFALALVVVHVKLDQLADTTVQVGFYCVLAAAALTELDGWSFRRAVVLHGPQARASLEESS